MKKNNYLLYDVDETPPFGKMFILALQHVLAMFGATILVPILVSIHFPVVSTHNHRDRSSASSCLRLCTHFLR